MPRQQKHEYRCKRVCQDIRLVINPFGHQAVAVERHDVNKEFQRIEKPGLHLSDECTPGEAIRIPRGQNAFVNRRGCEVIPGVTLRYRFPHPQDGELLREDDLPIEERHGKDDEEYPSSRSHGFGFYRTKIPGLARAFYIACQYDDII